MSVYYLAEYYLKYLLSYFIYVIVIYFQTASITKTTYNQRIMPFFFFPNIMTYLLYLLGPIAPFLISVLKF